MPGVVSHFLKVLTVNFSEKIMRLYIKLVKMTYQMEEKNGKIHRFHVCIQPELLNAMGFAGLLLMKSVQLSRNLSK